MIYTSCKNSLEMRIVGKYCRNNEFIDCNLIIKYGKIQEIFFVENEILKLTEFDSEFISNFKIEKHYDTKNSPYNSNYIIKIKSNNDFPHVIYVKLNFFNISRLKWNAKKYIIQSIDMKKDILKYFIGGIIGFLFGVLSQYINNSKIPSVNPPATESQKSLEDK